MCDESQVTKQFQHSAFENSRMKYDTLLGSLQTVCIKLYLDSLWRYHWSNAWEDVHITHTEQS
jgi:hypothetical protein